MIGSHHRFCKFLKNTSGSFVVFFGLGLAVIVSVGALAVDFANTLTTADRLQEYLDTSALNTSLAPDLDEDNVDDYGNKYLSEVMPDYMVLQSSSFVLEDNSIVRAEATVQLTNLFSRVFGDEVRTITRKSTVNAPLSNIDIHIFVDTSLTMGLPSAPVGNAMDITSPVNIADVTSGTTTSYDCFFSCHDDGSISRGMGYKIKIDVVTEAITDMINTINDAVSKKSKSGQISYTLYRYKAGEYYTDPDIDDNAWEWDNPGLIPGGPPAYADGTTPFDHMHDSVPVIVPVGMTADGADIEAYFTTPVALAGGTNLNTPLRVIHSTLEWRNEVRTWVKAGNDITDTAGLFASVSDRSATNRFFNEVKNGTYPDSAEALQNMAKNYRKTIVLFISDGDHRRSPEVFSQANCTNIKNLSDTELYSVMIYNDENVYRAPFAYTPEVEFTGGVMNAGDPAMAGNPRGDDVTIFNTISARGIMGLGMGGYTNGLNNAETLMRDCATDGDHFYKGEFEADLSNAFKNLTTDIMGTIPRLTEN